MRASRQPSVARSASSASPISGAMRERRRLQIVAAAREPVRDLRRRAPPAGREAAGSRGASSAAKTAAVDTGTPGQTSTSGSAGQPSSGSISSPIPRARSARPARHIGTSAPSLQADRARARPAAMPRPEEPVERQQHRRRVGRAAAEARPRPGCSSPRGSPRRRRQPGMRRRKPPPRARRDRCASPGACAAKRPGDGERQLVGRRDLDAGRRNRRRRRCCRADGSRRPAGRSHAARD